MCYSGSQQTFHPLNLQKLWTINSYVLVGDETVFIECCPLAPFWWKLELYKWYFDFMSELGYCGTLGYRHKFQMYDRVRALLKAGWYGVPHPESHLCQQVPTWRQSLHLWASTLNIIQMELGISLWNAKSPCASPIRHLYIRAPAPLKRDRSFYLSIYLSKCI